MTKATGPSGGSEGEALAKTMRGEMVPADIFDLAAQGARRIPQAEARPARRGDPRARAASKMGSPPWRSRRWSCCRCSRSSCAALFGVGIPASGPIVQHLTLWVGFLGAAIAAREGKLLALATGTLMPAGAPRRAAADLRRPRSAACVAAMLAWGGDPAGADRARGRHDRSAPASRRGSRSWCCRSGSRSIAVRLVWRAERRGGADGCIAVARPALPALVDRVRIPGAARGPSRRGPGSLIVDARRRRSARRSSRSSAAPRCCCS